LVTPSRTLVLALPSGLVTVWMTPEEMDERYVLLISPTTTPLKPVFSVPPMIVALSRLTNEVSSSPRSGC